MATTTRDTTPYWTTSAAMPQFAALDGDATADVVVVGGGITGLTAAYLLTPAGKSVAVLERGRCAQVDTGHTSAHLTMVTDIRLTELVSRVRPRPRPGGLGRRAGRDRPDRRRSCASTSIDCDFEWVPGYLHAAGGAPRSDGRDATLREEAALAAELGLRRRVRRRRAVRRTARASRSTDQARFHPAQVSRRPGARDRRAAAGGSTSTARPRSSRDDAAVASRPTATR